MSEINSVQGGGADRLLAPTARDIEAAQKSQPVPSIVDRPNDGDADDGVGGRGSVVGRFVNTKA